MMPNQTPNVLVAFRPEELDLVLAALRLWQQVYEQVDGDMPTDLLDIAESHYSTDEECESALWRDMERMDQMCAALNAIGGDDA